MLSASAFNAFLKTLEEPPSYAIFILATTEKHKILPTILSRCQIFDFKRITINDTVNHLEEIIKKEEIHADKAALQIIAQKSEGCLRDALSILDKIESFTNGKIEYSNTLEHLNILDADYYFKLLDSMMQQDLAGALLLYDEINRKGFEGDLVLEGLSEFIRNLLVCKDERVAELLEAVESFKEKYIETAKKTPSAFLISALNVLNETEINYKAARNKRLHTELALIRLCYLQQALELTQEGNSLSKKKVTEAAKAVSYRNITPFGLKKENKQIPKTKSNESRLIIETSEKAEEKVFVEEDASSYNKKETSKSSVRTSSENSPTTNKLTALDKIRKQYKGNGNNGNGFTNHPIDEKHLKECWKQYVGQLKKAKNPAVQSFEMVSLRIADKNSFEIIASNNLQQKFIEGERNKLFAYLQEQLQNRLLQFTVLIEEKPGEKLPAEISLTSREQFQKMAEQYPLVKELKDRLKLELDY
jgi:DNA polymerase-3 subunit gamma/tau